MKKILGVIGLLAVISLGCGFFGGDKEPAEKEPEAAEAVEAIEEKDSNEIGGVTVDHGSGTGAKPAPDMEDEEDEDLDEPEASAANSDAPMFFVDEFDGPLNTTDWALDEYFFLPDGVEEDDEEAQPVYSVEQERGALKFSLDSPYLYLYQTYTPHKYENVRIDFEVENKGVNTNNIGLFCRSTDYGWYEFIATSGGYYSIMRYYEDEDKELAYGGIKSIKFGKDKKNVFTAICRGKTLVFIVNDVEIAKVKDEEILDAGYVGINVSSEAYVPVNVELNWLSISEP